MIYKKAPNLSRARAQNQRDNLLSEMEVSPIFVENYFIKRRYGEEKRIVVNQGGTSSGKTYSLMQVLFAICMNGEILAEQQDESHFGNSISVRVVGRYLTQLKKDALTIAQSLAAMLNGANGVRISFNASSSTFSFRQANGSVSTMLFVGLDNPEAAKFGKFDYSYICEATSILYEVYQAIQVRTKQVLFLDFNPSVAFWAHEHLLDNKYAKFIISTYRDNPFLPDAILDSILYNSAANPDWKRVYADGLVGKVEGLVFPHFQTCEHFPTNCKFILYGLDFGWTDETAFVRIGFFDGGLYVDELIYGSKISMKALAAMVKDIMYEERKTYLFGSLPIISADAASPSYIDYLEQEGILIEAVEKANDAKRIVINYINSRKLFFTRRSKNLIKEAGGYRHKINRNTGEFTEETSDGRDHGMDAMRYGIAKWLLEYNGEKGRPIKGLRSLKKP